MTVYALATTWIGLALFSSVLASKLKVSNALVDILIGIGAASAANHFIGPETLGSKAPWITFLASTAATLLTFLAGAELDPVNLRRSWKEVLVVGIVSFAAPFLGCAALARYVLKWSPEASYLAGVALSTTSMAVIYSIMLELGLNKTAFGKNVLGACFVTNLGTLIALGILFAPFNIKTVIFIVIGSLVLFILPFITTWLLKRFGNRPTEFETKWILLVLFGMGALATWAGSEAVLPAYLAGMVLAGTVGRDHKYLVRLRTLTLGLLTPFYFIRAGSYVSVPALIAAPMAFFVLFSGKISTKILGLLHVIGRFRSHSKERWYYTLLMSTGLTFGSISAMFGLTHGIISQAQYSHLVAVVIGSTVIPVLIANALFFPRHLLEQDEAELEATPASIT